MKLSLKYNIELCTALSLMTYNPSVQFETLIQKFSDSKKHTSALIFSFSGGKKNPTNQNALFFRKCVILSTERLHENRGTTSQLP
jgi:hypothetical protein